MEAIFGIFILGAIVWAIWIGVEANIHANKALKRADEAERKWRESRGRGQGSDQ